MKRRHSVKVPAAQADLVVEALLGAYARSLASLASSLRAYASNRAPWAAVAEARREVIEAEESLDVAGWHREARLDGLELTGPAGHVRDVLYAALVAATQSARLACHHYEHGRIDRARLAATVNAVAGLHELFATFEATDAPDEH